MIPAEIDPNPDMGKSDGRRVIRVHEAKRLLGVAFDGGPRENLVAMADGDICVMANIPEPQHAYDPDWWARALGKSAYAGLVVGTSESERGRRIESVARCAAARTQKPIFVLEDYPGNFHSLDDAPTSELVVESDAVAAWHKSRGYLACPRILVWPTPRYDQCRRQRMTLRDSLGKVAGKPPIVLWAGQPETEANIASLMPLLPILGALKVKIAIKAHPKDAGYPKRYSDMFFSRGIEIQDFSYLTVTQAMEQGPTLVITQYSSVAVEAGFYGIPSLHVLFDDVAGAALVKTKGYAAPFWVQAGAAASLKDASDAPAILSRLFHDDAHRASIIERFDSYFCSHAGSARELAARWLGMATSSTSSQRD